MELEKLSNDQSAPTTGALGQAPDISHVPVKIRKFLCSRGIWGDLPPGRPSFITRVLGVDSCRFGLGQARRARSPQVAQALGALQRVFCCPAMSVA